MSLKTRNFYEFGPFRLEAGDGLLLRNGQVVSLPPKTIDLLVVLVENSGRVLGKDELMSRVWPDSFVEQANLSHHVFLLRKALGEDPDGNSYIETIPRRGYRFVTSVNEVREIHGESDTIVVRERTNAHIVIEEEAETAKSTTPPMTDIATESAAILPQHQRTTIASRGGRRWLVASGLLVAAVAGILLWKGLSNDNRPESHSRDAAAADRASMKITRVTNSGLVANSTISPDGRFIAYGENYPTGAGTIRVRQVGTNSEIELLPAGERVFGGTAFSSDGAFVYYTVYDREDPNGALCRVPVLGGPVMRLVRNCSSMFTLSPDSQRVTFYRNDPDGKRRHLIVAALDGSEEELLMTRDRRSLYFSGMPAWAPDGTRIAFGATTERGIQDLDSKVSLFTIELSKREVAQITKEQWIEIGKTTWKSDGRGLIFVASRPRSGNQLYHLSYPGGEVTRITSDLHSYGNYGIGITADSSIVVADLYERSGQLWSIGTDGDASRAEPLTSGRSDGYSGLAGLAADRIVYTSRSGDDSDLWSMRDDGSEQKPLTSDSFFEGDVSASSDGNYLVFASDRAGGSHIFRMDADGSNLLQLTGGERVDASPDCSPDGKWVVYASYSDKVWTIWKVSIDGGERFQLTDYESVAPTFSPDGEFIACVIPSDSRLSNGSIAVIPSQGGAPVKLFKVIPFAYSYAACRWAPDGRALVYNVRERRANNLWEQPLAGGTPRRLTTFKNDHIFNFAYARDGKRMIVSRGQYIVNVVSIKHF
jgi:Tol biopolymer transport system component/DNA-binding winged helix-turn-helix (wHTH) protein